ncbi:uncharacterized protein LOC142585465 isoform X2 [Dermacentor variabilis]|uniref:uncharacterized protein LOC142585465 isoform X2 n=1 Tax=Dermacentor variabilis TaxID=34621 RepID=UPI003F5C3AC1
MSCLHLFALVVLATCGLFCAVHANMEDTDGALSRSLQQLYAGDSPFARSRGYGHDLDWILGHQRARPSKRLSEFLGGPGKRYSEFLGGPGKRYSEFLGGPGKRYSEFLGGPGKRSVADDVMVAAAERSLLHSSSAEQQESGSAAGSLRK